MSVVRDFILIVVKVKQCSERSQRYHFKSSEVKQRSECSELIHLNSSESKNTVVSVVRYFILTGVKKGSVASVVNEVKQRSEGSQIFHFNSSEVKQHSECSQ